MATPPDLDQLKQRMRAVWMSGDFGKIAEYSAKGAEAFVARLAIPLGARVLDVACGTGNLAIPAARAGARVTGVDIATNLIDQARQRAAAEHLDAAFEEGDAEQLLYPDGSFDVVMSMFGAMFAPRPDVTAAELLRVCRSGGRIAMANWTPEGFVGELFTISSKHVPPPPGVAPPVRWGDEATARERFSAGSSDIKLSRRAIEFDYPFAPGEVVQFFREYFGPTSTAFNRLDLPGQAALAADLEALWHKHNQASGGRTRIFAEYLEVLVTRA